MMGHLTGVATQLLKKEPKALQVHCLAHFLNLCLLDVAKSSKIVRDTLGLITEIKALTDQIRSDQIRHYNLI